MIFIIVAQAGMGGKVGFCGMKKAPIRQVGAYERLSAARDIARLRTR